MVRYLTDMKGMNILFSHAFTLVANLQIWDLFYNRMFK